MLPCYRSAAFQDYHDRVWQHSACLYIHGERLIHNVDRYTKKYDYIRLFSVKLIREKCVTKIYFFSFVLVLYSFSECVTRREGKIRLREWVV